MTNKKTIQNYINNFRKDLLVYLKPGLGLKINVYPSKSQGAIIEVYFDFNTKNEDIYKEEKSSVNEALKEINQRAFAGDLSSFHFSGTNIIMEDKKIILIKGDDFQKEWDRKKAHEDVSKIVTPSIKGGSR